MLILEDEFIIAMDLEQLCRDHGASDAQIVRTLAELDGDPEQRFDAAIIDVMLGGETTLPVARRLVASGMPFVFATGFSATEEMLAEFRGVPVVGKPYSSDDVIVALSQAIARKPD